MQKQMRVLLVFALLVALLHPSAAWAGTQEERGPSGETYQLDIELVEKKDGKAIDTRHYSIRARDRSECRIRTGNRVPIPAGTGTQYMDVGLSIDCLLRTAGENINLDISFELESFALPESAGNAGAPPLLRTVSSHAATAVTPGTKTKVLSIDDATSGSRFDLEVTITKVN